jgi:hypothetical protein
MHMRVPSTNPEARNDLLPRKTRIKTATLPSYRLRLEGHHTDEARAKRRYKMDDPGVSPGTILSSERRGRRERKKGRQSLGAW